jgi:hypothetical protein
MPDPAPEPVEVEADELAAAERRIRIRLRTQHDGPRSVMDDVRMVLAEYDRMRAELVVLTRQADASEHAANSFYAHAAAMELQRDQARADLSRALPVVEAAGAVVEKWGSTRVQDEIRYCSVDLADLLDALARAVRAAREPRTGEGTK